MNRSFLKTAVCLICLGFATGAYAQSNPLPMAADFTLPFLRSDGELTLSEVLPRKEFTVLIFFDSRCAECMDTFAELKHLPEELEKNGISAQVFGINTDRESLGRIRSFVKGEGIAFPVLSDAFGWTPELYRCSPYSFSYFVVDKQGRLRDYHLDKLPNAGQCIVSGVRKAMHETTGE